MPLAMVIAVIVGLVLSVGIETAMMCIIVKNRKKK